MENSDDPGDAASRSPSSTKATVTIDETVHMPTTAQLMEFMRHINPFEQKFREANEAMKAGDLSQILASLSSASSICDQGTSHNDPTLASLSDTTLSVLRAASSSKSPSELRLKLPDASVITAALSGVCSLLNVDGDGGGCELDTPDIANLVTQMREESTSKSAPLTADVLKTVLEIRETLDLQREKKLSNLESQHQCDDQEVTTTYSDQSYQSIDHIRSSSMSGKTPPDVGCLDRSESATDIGPCDSLLSADIDAHRLSSSPPALAVQESPGPVSLLLNDQMGEQLRLIEQQQRQQQQHQGIGSVSSTASTATVPLSHSRSGDNVIIALKIGDQAVQIPLKINVSAGGVSSVSSAGTSAVTPAISHRKFSGNYLSVTPKPDFVSKSTSATVTSSFHSRGSGQQILYSASGCGQVVAFENMMSSNRAPSVDVEDEEYRKREVLERNKQAACRYRKRKKEEMTLLQEKLQKAETEKLELSTQVQILRMELERVRNLLDLHKDCPVTKEQSKKKQRKLDFLSLENRLPVFRSPVSSGDANSDNPSPSDSPPEQRQRSSSQKDASAAAGPSIMIASGIDTKPSATVARPSLLPSQSNVFETATATGQVVQYVALPSPVQPGVKMDGGDIVAGQHKFILQPVLVPGSQAVVLPGTSSSLIFPTIVKVSAAQPASNSGTFMSSPN